MNWTVYLNYFEFSRLAIPCCLVLEQHSIKYCDLMIWHSKLHCGFLVSPLLRGILNRCYFKEKTLYNEGGRREWSQPIVRKHIFFKFSPVWEPADFSSEYIWILHWRLIMMTTFQHDIGGGLDCQHDWVYICLVAFKSTWPPAKL